MKNLTINRYLNSETFLFLALLAFAFFASAYHLPLLNDITFSFASIFLFLILRLYGLRLAVAAMLLTFWFIPHEFVFIAYGTVLLLEILFVGVYFKIKKKGKMFFVDAVFWLSIGILAIYLINFTSLTGDALYFQFFKVIFNGLLNILIADMLLAYLPFYRWLNKSIPLNKNNVSIHQLLSHVTILSVMMPFILILLTKTLSGYGSQESVIEELLIFAKLSLMFLLIVVGIAIIVNRLFMNNFKKLITATTRLPEKLNNLEKIEWPQAYISELRLFSQNLKEMTNKISELFHESKEMNSLLTRQTQKLKESEDKLHQLAYYDVLTSLPNRLHFQTFVKDLINNFPTQSLAVMFMDLNKFKQVNDIFGHDVGDALLKLTANRLCHIKDFNIEVFRLGGDEFVVVQQFKDREEVDETLKKIRYQFTSPFVINGQVLNISESVGVSLYPDDGEDLNTLVKYADIAMYVSKETPGNYAQFFESTMREKLQARLLIENSLRKTIDQGGFNFYYQPKVKNGTVSSVEALIRWKDPVLGNVSPAVFIPIAEEIGLISKIDKLALIEACKQNKKWQDDNVLRVPISINISAKNFQHDELILWIKSALQESGMNPKYLIIEITESVFIKDLNHVKKIINELSKIGVRISIDDFGKGYSSLNQLVELPIDEIKIDRKLIKDINKNKKQQLIVKSIIDIAIGLNLNVVAEGVETEFERKIITDLKCHEIQGYLFFPPLNPNELERYLLENNKAESLIN